MTSRLITPQLAEQFKLYPLYSQDGKKKYGHENEMYNVGTSLKEVERL